MMQSFWRDMDLLVNKGLLEQLPELIEHSQFSLAKDGHFANDHSGALDSTTHGRSGRPGWQERITIFGGNPGTEQGGDNCLDDGSAFGQRT